MGVIFLRNGVNPSDGVIFLRNGVKISFGVIFLAEMELISFGNGVKFGVNPSDGSKNNCNQPSINQTQYKPKSIN